MLHGCECPVNELDMLVSAKTMLGTTLNPNGHLQLSCRVSKGTITSDGPATKHKTVCLVSFIQSQLKQN